MENNKTLETAEVQEKPADAPLSIDVEQNDFVPKEVEMYQISMPEADLLLIANSLANLISRAWLFDPKETINDDVIASYGVLSLLKRLNANLEPEKRLGCVAEHLLPFEGGDIYIDALYRIDTTLKGKVIAAAAFSYDSDIITFRLFDPVKYPNARSLADCLGDRVPLRDVQSIEEVKSLTHEEMEAFCLAIREAWCCHY